MKETKKNRLSAVSCTYDVDNKGFLSPVEGRCRALHRNSVGGVPAKAILKIVKESERRQRRQWLLVLGNIVQWLPLVAGAIFTFMKFSDRQYKQNVGGRVISKSDYLKERVASGPEVDGMLNLSRGEQYDLTKQQISDYERDGFVALPKFLTKTESSSLDKVLSYNLDELAFPDMLTSCSRKLHGDHYHSTVTWRFWQQPRVSNMISKLALAMNVPYMVTSEILEMPNGATCIPQWHWDFLTFPQSFNASYTSGAQIWLSTESVDASMGGGLAFIPGSHKWANSIDDGAKSHECFVMNLFEPQSQKCQELLNSKTVIPTLDVGDIIVFSRFTLHRSVPRNPATPFVSGARKGYTLRMGSSNSIFKRDTMNCFPSHQSTNFQGQLQEGQRYDSILDSTGLPRDEAVYRPMNVRDSEDVIIGQESGRAMSISTFLLYSTESIFRQKIKWKLANIVSETMNRVTGNRSKLDLGCKASPIPDF